MRYVGSKRKLAKDKLPFPNGKLIEPFVGGCNFIDKVNHPNRIGCAGYNFLIALLITISVLCLLTCSMQRVNSNLFFNSKNLNYEIRRN